MKMKDSVVGILKNESTYYVSLGICALLGMSILYLRSRFGVDLSDETWYISDPYWVAKGSIPYVNNWSQASGFTLPLYICYYAYLKIMGTNEGIIMFSRKLYCVWKTMVLTSSFVVMKRMKIHIPSPFLFTLIVFEAGQLFAINYNSIGLYYVILITSLIVFLLYSDDISHKKQMVISIMSGMLMGRSVIGTPATIVACLILLCVLIYKRKIISLIGYITGGIIAAIMVLSFCCYRGGWKNFVIGLQYFFKDLSYYESLEKHGTPLIDNIMFLTNYVFPAFATLVVFILLKYIIKLKQRLLCIILFIIASVLMLYSMYFFKRYSGQVIDIIEPTKYGWFIPIICSYCVNAENEKKGLQGIILFPIVNLLIFIVQGLTVLYGPAYRTYWNFSSIVFGMFSLYYCYGILFKKGKRINKAVILGMGVLAAIFIIRGSYSYIYRDSDFQDLTQKVETGVWKGCITTPQRSQTIVEIERILREKTDESDQVLCWGNWACFMNLLCDGKLCSASPLGSGTKNGFDFWHMNSVVPTKVFVNVDIDDSKGLMSDTRAIWLFISKYYEEVDEYRYCLYDESGQLINYKIKEFEVIDSYVALEYADLMATKVYEFER